MKNRNPVFILIYFCLTVLLFEAQTVIASEGVAIQRVITNTRSELGQLASSIKAQKIADLMKKFDTQYQTWSQSCGGSGNFNPAQVSDACQAMANQMRETGIALYGELSEYLPDVAARYEQGGQSAKSVLEKSLGSRTPAGLYQNTMNGISEAPQLGELSEGTSDSPFDLAVDDFTDPTEQMFSVLEKLVPDFGKEIPEAVRAGNTRISMMKKAKQARYLASQFKKAKLYLESKREYGEIIFNATQAVSAMPEVLGIQYTGTLLSAKPNQKVLEYYRKEQETSSREEKKQNTSGFSPRS